MSTPSSSSSPKKKQSQTPPPAQSPKQSPKLTPEQALEASLFTNPPLTQAQLVEGLSKVVEELQVLLDNPSTKPLKKEVTEQMEKIRQMSGFLTAVYANMIRIAVEEEGMTPQPPNTEEQKALAQRTEILGWTLRALQEKAAICMNPPALKVPASAKKRKSRMERTQGDREWKRM